MNVLKTIYLPVILTLTFVSSSLCLMADTLTSEPDSTSYTGVQNPTQGEALADSLLTVNTAKMDDPAMAEKLVADSRIADKLDSLANITFFLDSYFTTDTAELNIYGFEPDEVPKYPDSVFISRIESLNAETPIELTFNKTVRTYINLYAVKKRALTSKMLGLAEVYFPMFEEYLDKYDMPLELKYLAVVESALNPTAGSWAGAKGLWQFMYSTGKVYGLKVTSLVDDRYDPYLATDAACRHMIDLYEVYEDWSLVMAAYNSGPGNVNKAIRRAGGVKNYWAVWPYLPRETRGYVPAFIAVTYVMNYAPEHNLYPIDPGILYNGIDTVMVNEPLAFDQISEKLGIPYEEIDFLNPAYKKGIIPVKGDKKYFIRLPKSQVGAFIDNEAEIYNYVTKAGLEKEKLLAEIKKAQERQIHVVRSGENLGLIAKRYRVYVNQIKQWNNLRSSTIYPGQRLTIYPTNFDYVASNTSSKNIEKGEKQIHTVRRGENLGLIAKKYGCSVSQLKSWNNISRSTIYPNQKLVVYGGGVVSSGGKNYVYYTVRKGDTLWDIAKKYKGATISEIKALNNISNSNKLRVGQKLKVAVDG